MTQVDWKTYAKAYDMLMTYNPFYQELHADVMEQVSKWELRPGAVIADLGAGTGNYSLAMANKFPYANVLHIDSNEGMNATTVQKREQMELGNHRILDIPVEKVKIEAGTVDAVLSVHALYAFNDPKKVLQKSFEWLRPGGKAILVDAGRIVNVLTWQLAIGWRLIRKYGLQKSLEIFSQAKEISTQNAYIREMQRNGTYWTHSHEEFLQAVELAGYQIQQAKTVFRGISDCVIAYKP